MSAFVPYLQLKVIRLAQLGPENAFELMREIGGDISFSPTRGPRNDDGTVLAVRGVLRSYGQWLNQSGDVMNAPTADGAVPVIELHDRDAPENVVFRLREENAL